MTWLPYFQLVSDLHSYYLKLWTDRNYGKESLMGWNRCFSNKKGSITLLAGYIRKWLYIYLEKSFFPSDRVWLNMTLGIWNCFWSHKNYFWRREDAYDIDYTNIHSRAHSSLNWDMPFSINISLFAMHILHGTQIHHCWHHRNSILKRRVIVEWEH